MGLTKQSFNYKGKCYSYKELEKIAKSNGISAQAFRGRMDRGSLNIQEAISKPVNERVSEWSKNRNVKEKTRIFFNFEGKDHSVKNLYNLLKERNLFLKEVTLSNFRNYLVHTKYDFKQVLGKICKNISFETKEVTGEKLVEQIEKSSNTEKIVESQNDSVAFSLSKQEYAKLKTAMQCRTVPFGNLELFQILKSKIEIIEEKFFLVYYAGKDKGLQIKGFMYEEQAQNNLLADDKVFYTKHSLKEGHIFDLLTIYKEE